MGLDQYLTVRKYVSPIDYASAGMEPSSSEIEMNLKINSILELAGAASLKLDVEQRNFSKGIYLEQIGLQWRKQYAISDWFEAKLGEMENCKRYSVPREWLEEFLSSCEKILEKMVWSDIPDQYGQKQFVSIDAGFASTLVPQSNSNDYDGWYAYGIEQTRDGLKQLLGAEDLKDAEFQYHGWW